MSLFELPLGNRPFLGNGGFAVQIDEPVGACFLTPGSVTFLMVGFGPGSLILPGLGCLPGTPGEIQVVMTPPPLALGPIPWPGPGIGAVYPAPIPFDSALCGASVSLQGLWVDPFGPSGPFIMTWALDLFLGS